MKIINYQKNEEYHRVVRCSRRDLKGLKATDFKTGDLVFVSKYNIEIQTDIPEHGRTYLNTGGKLLKEVPLYIENFLSR